MPAGVPDPGARILSYPRAMIGIMNTTDTLATIPSGLDGMAPGPVLAAILASIDVAALSGRDQLVVLRAHQRMISHHQARLYENMTAVVDTVAGDDHDDPVLAAEGAAAEIRVALRLTRRAADRELDTALGLRRRLPGVFAALQAGRIDPHRARVLLDETAHLSVASARRVVARVLEDASWLTTGQLRARLQRLGMEANPDEARDRYRHAVAERRVVIEATSDGTAHLMGLELPPDRVAAARERIDRLARDLRHPGESRTMDQLRADVYLDLLCGTAPETRRGRAAGVVDLRVDLATLAELAETPGELGGYGPVIADIARRVAVDHPRAEWRYTVTDPDTGRPVAGGVTRRRPTAAQRRAAETRDGTCIFPGCRMPAVGSDLDHRVRVADGGKTRVCDLAPLCRHDHCLRHCHGWRHELLPNGDHRWTSPLGQIVTTWGTDGIAGLEGSGRSP